MRTCLTCFLLLIYAAVNAQPTSSALLSPLQQKTEALAASFDQIAPDRLEKLQETAAYLAASSSAGKGVHVLFVCTHNSRRSQIAQAWAEAGAVYFGFELSAYSGGTEATAFHPHSRAALSRAGFQLAEKNGKNPKVRVIFSDQHPACTFYSKRYQDAKAPKGAFAAVMVCSDADEACPYVSGAGFRMALPYTDPKRADFTPDQDKTYDETVDLIGREVLYLCAAIRQLMDPDATSANP